MSCKNDINYDSNYTNTNTEVIAYYSGDATLINDHDLNGVTQLIYLSLIHI